MNMSKFLERYNIALETGEWWNIQWWKDYYDDQKREEIEDSFEVLKVIFDAKWVNDQRDRVITMTKEWLRNNEDIVKKNNELSYLKEELEKVLKPSEAYQICGSILGYYPVHPLFNDLFAEGKSYFEFLVALGSDLLDVGEADLMGDLYNRLKDTNNYEGAYFELRILAYLKRRGFSIQRHPPSGIGKKKCDIRVSKGSEVLFVELKNLLKPSEVNNNISSISYKLFHEVISEIPGSYMLHLELSEILCEKAKTKKGQRNLWSSIPMIVQQIKEHIAKRINNGEWGCHTVHGLAEYHLYQRQRGGLGGQGRFTGLPLLQQAEADKMFRNAVRDAVNQLPQDKPGILMVELPFFIDSYMIGCGLSSRFKKNKQKYKHLSAVILMHNRMELVRNSYAVQDVTNYAAIRDIFMLSG
ncbi:MAG TPA: hypothetical protein ACFYD0_10815 [Candidatus Wunengus sp. YC65]|uniref:hypothetical protein n=1 Tax=Candidatus Wunengus sp. YC65 TaxID=3367701 RepID=UPI004026354C